MCCPACAAWFRAHPHPHRPVTLAPCGHSLCGLCREGVVTGGASCPVCNGAVRELVVNVGLGEAGEAAFAVGGGSGAVSLPCEDCTREAAADPDYQPSAASVKCSACDKACCTEHGIVHARKRGHDASIGLDSAFPECVEGAGACLAHPGNPLSFFCNTDKTVVCGVCAVEGHKDHTLLKLNSGSDSLGVEVRSAAARCVAGGDVAMGGVDVVVDAITALAASKSAAIAAFGGEISALKASLDAVNAEFARRVGEQHEDRLKVLETQRDALTVSGSQLRACGAMCDRALAGGSPLALARACESAHAMGGLLEPFLGPSVPGCVDMVADLSDLKAALASVKVCGCVCVCVCVCVRE